MPPRRALGVVVGSTIGNALSVTPTIVATFGVFLVAIAAEFHWPRAEVSGALAVVTVAMALSTPLTGLLGDRIGARRTLLIGSLCAGLGILTLSMAPANPLVFYAQFALVGVVGALYSGMVYAKLIAEWFNQGRGMWIGIAGGVGNGIGCTLLPIIASALFLAVGWRGAFTGIALVILLVGLPIQFWLLRDPPAALPATDDTQAEGFEGLSLKQTLKTVDFWLLVTAMPIGSACLVAVFSTIVPILTDRGFSLEAATLVVSLCALACAMWEPSVGAILDRVSRPRVLLACYLAACCGLLLMLYGPNIPSLVLGGVLIALGLGAEFSALSFLLSRYFGRRALGSISGVAFGIGLAASAVAIVLLNAAYDSGGNYRLPVLAMLPFLVWNGVALLFLGPYRFAAAEPTEL